jgi:hypothetical protein
LAIIEQRVHESAADLTRAVGEAAESLGLVRPSYEQVRVLRRRAELESDRVTTADVLFDIAIRARPAYDLPNWWYGDPLPWRPAAKNERRSRD